ncbi:MAG: hypothetical protein PF692_03550 [Kiritimatiellae bacterium]|jgi:hypothetical protein|nr:hypothetical protein [Kiritimatiellia bacterium]
MKYYTKLIMLAVFMVANFAYSQTNFTENVSKMWLNGQKAEVYTIATNRLAINTNDMAGLMLKMEYEFTFLVIDDLTNTIERVTTVGNTICSTNFVAIYTNVQKDVAFIKTMVNNYPLSPAELAEDRIKGAITNKPLACQNVLIALKQDGCFQ